MTETINQNYRQGDVYIFKVKSIPKEVNLQETQESVLALGEVTGHSHRVVKALIAGALTGNALRHFQEENGEMGKVTYLSVPEEGATVLHEEHHAIQLPKGEYEVHIQREYDPLTYQRKVLD